VKSYLTTNCLIGSGDAEGYLRELMFNTTVATANGAPTNRLASSTYRSTPPVRPGSRSLHLAQSCAAPSFACIARRKRHIKQARMAGRFPSTGAAWRGFGVR